MSDHDYRRAHIPAYVASRLGEDDRRGLEGHLAVCPDCAGMVTTVRAIRDELRREETDRVPAGDPETAPHPDHQDVRACALASPQRRDRAVARHVALCASCELEAAAWTAHALRASDPAAAAADRSRGPRGTWDRRAAVAASLAAGLVIGLVLARLPRRQAPPEARVTNEGFAEVPRPPAGAPDPWTGPVRLFELPNPLRAGGPETELVLPRDQPYALLAVQPDMSGAERGAAACGFEIHDAMGRLVWSLEVPAAIVRERLRSDEVLILPVPAPPLTDGRYEMTIRTAGEAGESFATRIPFVIRRPG